MDPYSALTRPYYKSYKSWRSCALCYDENYNIKILKDIEEIVIWKVLVGNVLSKLINMLKILYIKNIEF
jgi:hypothetical protein